MPIENSLKSGTVFKSRKKTDEWHRHARIRFRQNNNLKQVQNKKSKHFELVLLRKQRQNSLYFRQTLFIFVLWI